MTAPVPSWETIFGDGSVRFAVDDHQFTVAEHPVRIWGPALLSTDLEDVLPGLLPADQQTAWGDIVWDTERVFTRELHQRIVNAVVGDAAAMPYTACMRLLATYRAMWRDVDGWAASQRLDLLSLPLHRFCNLLYGRIVSNMAEKDRAVFDADLFAPPPDADPDDPQGLPGWTEGDMGAAFGAALANFQAATGQQPVSNRAGTPDATPSPI